MFGWFIQKKMEDAAIEASKEIIKEGVADIVPKEVKKLLMDEIKQLHKQLRYNYKQRFKDTRVVTFQLLKEDDNYWYVSADYAEGKLHKRDAVKIDVHEWLVSESILIDKCLDNGAT